MQGTRWDVISEGRCEPAPSTLNRISGLLCPLIEEEVAIIDIRGGLCMVPVTESSNLGLGQYILLNAS